jgi:hypothetical protein
MACLLKICKVETCAAQGVVKSADPVTIEPIQTITGT